MPSVDASMNFVGLGREGSAHFESSDDESSVADGSTCSRQNQGDGDTPSEPARKNDHLTLGMEVARMRAILSVLLTVTALTVSLTIATKFNRNEQDKYKQAFFDDTETLWEHIGIRGAQNLNALASLGTSMTSHGSRALVSFASSAWPFAIAPDFAVQGVHALDILNSTKTFFAPTVESTERVLWETFATEVFNASMMEPKPPSFIYKVDQSGNKVPEDDFNTERFNPVWQIAPQDDPNDLMLNLRSIPTVARSVDHAVASHQAVMTPTIESEVAYIESFHLEDAAPGEPVSLLVVPVFAETKTAGTANSDSSANQVVGVVAVPFLWKSYLVSTFSGGTQGLIVVIRNACVNANPANEVDGQDDHTPLTYTYEIDQNRVKYVGAGDLHLDFYSSDQKASDFPSILRNVGFETTVDGIGLASDYCPYEIIAYPSASFQNSHMTSSPIKVTTCVVLIFCAAMLVFFYFGSFTARRLELMEKKAAHTRKLVDTLFPKDIQERMFRAHGEEKNEDDPLAKIKAILAKEKEKETPICDLWPNCTVMFADISGFTAWSSQRDPAQVFELLEALFNAFDQRTTSLGVFKVETVGDCYVAVAGLPTPRKDHALVMTRFAAECRSSMQKVTQRLAVTLGPDTADLQFRIGLNSGPVTAGVLRGDKGRFQLFGDTVNTAARIESSGIPGKIHISSTTAQLLMESGKTNWVKRRADTVVAKGKGELFTYWAEPKRDRTVSTASRLSNSAGPNDPEDDEYYPESCPIADPVSMRLIDWNVDTFTKMIARIIAHREASVKRETSPTFLHSKFTLGRQGTVIDEVKEVLEIEEYANVDLNVKPLDSQVVKQVRQFVSSVCCLYHANSFHNFEHACHVTMSVIKLQKRIVAPVRSNGNAQSLHDHTYGLASDPLTQFACVFSGLVHDIDHSGVPNTCLVDEGSAIATHYNNKSVAEQNSVDVIWGLFSDEVFADLRAAICATPKEFARFRQLVVNCVMATDIMDKDLKKLRNDRWDKAFGNDDDDDCCNIIDQREDSNRKATVVIELMIQASDVAHTMQHWHIYRKWNERLFAEMHHAYKAGRSPKDPADFWYQGEIGFFDFYILPLAKKLASCGVFGVSSDEYLNYAQKNREEWVAKGQGVVAMMVDKLKKQDE